MCPKAHKLSLNLQRLRSHPNNHKNATGNWLEHCEITNFDFDVWSYSKCTTWACSITKSIRNAFAVVIESPKRIHYLSLENYKTCLLNILPFIPYIVIGWLKVPNKRTYKICYYEKYINELHEMKRKTSFSRMFLFLHIAFEVYIFYFMKLVQFSISQSISLKT